MKKPQLEYDRKLRKKLGDEEKALEVFMEDTVPAVKNKKDRLTVLVNNRFPDDKIVRYLEDGIEATTTSATKFGEIENPNWTARHKYLQTILDLGGYNDEFSTGSKSGKQHGGGYMLLQQNISVHTDGDSETKGVDSRIIEQGDS